MGYVSHTAAGVAGGGADVTLDEPTGSAGEDIYVLCGPNNTTADWTAPAVFGSTLDSDVGSDVFRRTDAGTGGTSRTFTRTGNTTGAAGVVMVRWSGGGTPTVADLINGTGTSIALPSVNAAAGDDSLQIMFRVTVGATGWTAPGDGSGTPGNPIERADADMSGTSLRFAIGEESGLSSGATGTRTWTVQSGPTRGVHITIPRAAVDLTVADAIQAQATDTPTLTQVHVLDVADPAQAQSVDDVLLTQVHVLAVDDTAQGQTADAPTLTQLHVLAVDRADQGQTASGVTLTQVHDLSVDSATQPQVSGSPELVVTVDLVVDSTAHAQNAERLTLEVSTSDLTVADALHAQSADNVTLTVEGDLQVDSAAHAQTADTPTLTVASVLEVQGGHHVHAADNLALTQVHQLAISAAAQAQAVLEVMLTQVHALAVDDAQQAVSSGEPALFTFDELQPTPPERTSVAAVSSRTSVATTSSRTGT